MKSIKTEDLLEWLEAELREDKTQIREEWALLRSDLMRLKDGEILRMPGLGSFEKEGDNLVYVTDPTLELEMNYEFAGQHPIVLVEGSGAFVPLASGKPDRYDDKKEEKFKKDEFINVMQPNADPDSLTDSDETDKETGDTGTPPAASGQNKEYDSLMDEFDKDVGYDDADDEIINVIPEEKITGDADEFIPGKDEEEEDYINPEDLQTSEFEGGVAEEDQAEGEIRDELSKTDDDTADQLEDEFQLMLKRMERTAGKLKPDDEEKTEEMNQVEDTPKEETKAEPVDDDEEEKVEGEIESDEKSEPVTGETPENPDTEEPEQEDDTTLEVEEIDDTLPKLRREDDYETDAEDEDQEKPAAAVPPEDESEDADKKSGLAADEEPETKPGEELDSDSDEEYVDEFDEIGNVLSKFRHEDDPQSGSSDESEKEQEEDEIPLPIDSELSSERKDEDTTEADDDLWGIPTEKPKSEEPTESGDQKSEDEDEPVSDIRDSEKDETDEKRDTIIIPGYDPDEIEEKEKPLSGSTEDSASDEEQKADEETLKPAASHADDSTDKSSEESDEAVIGELLRGVENFIEHEKKEEKEAGSFTPPAIVKKDDEQKTTEGSKPDEKPSESSRRPAYKPYKKKDSSVPWVVAVLLLLAMIGAVTWYFMSQPAAESPVADQPADVTAPVDPQPEPDPDPAPTDQTEPDPVPEADPDPVPETPPADPASPALGLEGTWNDQATSFYSIIILSTADRSAAEAVSQEIADAGFRSTAYRATLVEGRTTWRVAVGQFESRNTAVESAASLPAPYRNEFFTTRINN